MTMQNFFPGFEEQEPAAAFLRGVQNRIGANPQQSIFGRFQAAQRAPFQTVFGFNQLLNPPGAGVNNAAQDANPFLNFAQNNQLIGTPSAPGIRQQAQNLFSQLNTGTGVNPDIRSQFAQPDSEQANSLYNLALTALLNRVSPLALGLLNLPSAGDVRNQFLSQTGGQPLNAAGQPNDFIGYLRNSLGLGLI